LTDSTRSGAPLAGGCSAATVRGATTAAIVTLASAATSAAHRLRRSSATIAVSAASTAPYGVTVMSWVSNEPRSHPKSRSTAHTPTTTAAVHDIHRLRRRRRGTGASSLAARSMPTVVLTSSSSRPRGGNSPMPGRARDGV
jgi:hypothetical protein